MPPEKVPYSEGALTDAVRKHRVIWDYTMKTHYKKNLQAKAWGEIAAGFLGNITVEFCKGEFKRLRDNRAQRKRRMKGNCKSGAPGSEPPVNFQGDALAWLDEIGSVLSNRRESNLPRRRDLEGEDYDEADVDDPSSLGRGPILAIPITETSSSIRFSDQPPVTRNCCEDVFEANERREAELQLRSAPGTASPSRSTTGPSGTAPARREREASPAGSDHSTSSLAQGRTRRARNPPNRFSPSDPSGRSRGLDDSFASNWSTRSDRSTSARRRRRPFVLGDIRETDLSAIHEQDTLLGSSNSEQAQPAAASSPVGGRVVQVVQADVHVNADGSPARRMRVQDRVQHGSPSPGPQPGPTRTATSPAVQRYAQSPPLSDHMFSPSVRNELREVRARVVSTPSSRGNRRTRRLSQHWTQAPLGTAQQGRGRVQGRPRNEQGPPPANRGAGRQAQAEARDRERQQVQMLHEARREALRDNIRIQAELAQQRRQPAQAAQPDQGAEGADMALLRQFLTEKEQDVYGAFGQTIAAILRTVPAAVSGKMMADIFVFANEVSHLSEEERQDYLTSTNHLSSR